MKDYSIKIVDGHHVVDMSHKPSGIDIAFQNAVKHYGDVIKAAAHVINEKWGMK